MEQFDVILVGGGPASRILNKYLHLQQPGIRTAVIRDEERIVNHCGTPYIVEGVIPWEKGLIPEELVTRFDTPIITDPMVGGNPEKKWIETASGARYKYQLLVLATGTDQVLPDIPGTDLENVLKVRRTQDVMETMDRLLGLDRIVVLGAGYIGLEFAVSLRNLGKDVTVVELQPRVLGGRFDTEFTDGITSHLKAKGIAFRTGVPAVAIEGQDDRVSGIQLADGFRVEADAVLSAVGVRPMIDYADALGLSHTPQGLVVSEYFETNQPDIFAIGDCIEVNSRITGRTYPGKLGSNAGQMARMLALTLSGKKTKFKGVLNPMVSRFGDLAFGACGISELDARESGWDVLVGRAQSTSIYANMPGSNPVAVKALFRRSDLRFVGMEMLGQFNPAGFIESAAQLMEAEMDLYGVMTAPYASHPELTPKTSHPYLVTAAENAYKKLIG